MESSYVHVDIMYRASDVMSLGSVHKMATVCKELQGIMTTVVHKRYLSQIDKLIQDAALDLKQPTFSFDYKLLSCKSLWELKKRKFEVITELGQLLSPLYRLGFKAMTSEEYLEKVIETVGEIDSAIFLHKPRSVAYLKAKFLLEELCDQLLGKGQWISALQLTIFAHKNTSKCTYRNCGKKIASFLLPETQFNFCPPPEYLIDLIYFLAEKSLKEMNHILCRKLLAMLTPEYIKEHRICLEEGITRLSPFFLLSSIGGCLSFEFLTDLSSHFIDIGEIPLAVRCLKIYPKGVMLDALLLKIFPICLICNISEAKDVAALLSQPHDKDKCAKDILNSYTSKCDIITSDCDIISEVINLFSKSEDKYFYVPKFCDLFVKQRRYKEAGQLIQKFEEELSDIRQFRDLKYKVDFLNEIYSPYYLADDEVRVSNAKRLYHAYREKTLALDWANSIQNTSQRNSCFEYLFDVLKLYDTDTRMTLKFLLEMEEPTERLQEIQVIIGL